MTTTPADEMRALAARCEAAKGADTDAMRALGREVLSQCGKGYVSPLYAWLNPAISLDAAMTLVPKGMWRRINIDPNNHANIRLGDACAVTAATPALALCAAALRARATLMENAGE